MTPPLRFSCRRLRGPFYHLFYCLGDYVSLRGSEDKFAPRGLGEGVSNATDPAFVPRYCISESTALWARRRQASIRLTRVARSPLTGLID